MSHPAASEFPLPDCDDQHCAFDGCDDQGPHYLIGGQFFCSFHTAVVLCEEEVESCETL